MAGRRSINILGGGLFGFTAGLELAERGWQVRLFDQGQLPYPDAASTDISKVVRMDYGSDAVYTEMGELAIAGWQRWNEQWPEPLYHNTGFLAISRHQEMKPGSFEHDSYHYLSSRGHGLPCLQSDKPYALPSTFQPDYHRNGYYNPLGGWVDSRRVVERLCELAKLAGVQLFKQFRFASFLEKESHILGIQGKNEQWFPADRVLVATGAWTPFLLPELQGMLRCTGQPVIHYRPENVEAFQMPHFPVWASDIGELGWYGFPANADGIVKVANHGVGMPISEPYQPRHVTEGQIESFRSFLSRAIPSLAITPVAETRQCWYCDTLDGDFLIAHHPDRAGLVIAAGDSGHAFKFAPVLGAIIADLVEEIPNKFGSRFAWRTAQTRGEKARASASGNDG